MFNKIIGLAFAAIIAVGCPAVSFAQADTANVDSDHSTARLFVGSATHPESSNIGVARVSGTARLSGDDPQDSFDFTIYPADGSSNPSGSDSQARKTHAPLPARYTKMTFKSNHVVRNGDNLEVTGDLTLTNIARSITADANESYDGPQYGAPIVSTSTRAVTFSFRGAAVAQTGDATTLSASARIGYENFPELLPSLMAAKWPIFVEDETCQSPSTVGEDYAGASCAGMLVAPLTNVIPIASVGEDFHGFDSAAPTGNQVAIALDLRLVRTPPDTGVDAGEAMRLVKGR